MGGVCEKCKVHRIEYFNILIMFISQKSDPKMHHNLVSSEFAKRQQIFLFVHESTI